MPGCGEHKAAPVHGYFRHPVGFFDCGREFGGSSKVGVPLFPRVDKLMAACAKADEIFLGILSASTTRVDVVHLKIS